MNDIFIRPNGIPNLDPVPSIDRATDRSKTEHGGAAFSEILGNAIQEVNNLQSRAGEEVQKAMTGEITDIHTAMIAVQKADVSFQMMMQVRNKLVSAYQEIMKMQV
jgi:flagellar hook-basal body complex protein FliE